LTLSKVKKLTRGRASVVRQLRQSAKEASYRIKELQEAKSKTLGAKRKIWLAERRRAKNMVGAM